MVPLAMAVGLLLAGGSLVKARVFETPQRLSDAEFWQLTVDISEPNGSFQSDNLLSNEMGFQTIIPDLKKIVKPGVYMGVGPEQNFTYIAALQPKMVFITDIRRGNLELHLMYKALFEMSNDRADFVGMLFSKKRPEGLTATSTVGQIFQKYDAAPISAGVYESTWKRIIDHLTKAPHTLPLSADDIGGIKYVFDAFYTYGTALNYRSSQGSGGRGGNFATYEALMVTNDGFGAERSYLASEDLFKVVKDLETKNLLVPTVGNFAGPKALRAVGKYIREHGETVQAFYLSNVEDYLPMGGTWEAFCNNVASLPLTDASTFIFGARGAGGSGAGGGLASWYRPMAKDVADYKCKAH